MVYIDILIDGFCAPWNKKIYYKQIKKCRDSSAVEFDAEAPINNAIIKKTRRNDKQYGVYKRVVIITLPIEIHLNMPIDFCFLFQCVFIFHFLKIIIKYKLNIYNAVNSNRIIIQQLMIECVCAIN